MLSSRPDHPDGQLAFRPIPSQPREPGWNKVLAVLPRIASLRRSTHRELRALHGVATAGVDLPDYPNEVLSSFISQLLTGGRSVEEIEQVSRAVRVMPLATFFGIGYGASILPDIRCTLSAPRRGFVRRCGFREILGKPRETVYSGFKKDVAIGDLDTGGKSIFLGLDVDVDEVFTAFCARFEQMMDASASLEDRLRCLSWAQLMGVSLVHPFFDANHRAFAAHLALELKRLNIDVQEPPVLPCYGEAFGRDLFEMPRLYFMSRFLSERQIPLFSDEALESLDRNPRARIDYMQRLKLALMDGIEAGCDVSAETRPYLNSAWYFLALYLLEKNFLEDDQLPIRIARRSGFPVSS